jgi:endoglucanase
MRIVLPALLLPLAVGCVPIGAKTAPPGRGSDNSGSASSESGSTGTDDIALSIHNLVANATFADGTSLPWTSSFTAPAAASASVVDGALCLEVSNRGSNNWDVQLRHREMTIQKGHKYNISFVAYASQPTTIRPKVGMQGPPYAEYWFQEIRLDGTPRRFKAHFRKSGPDDPTAEFTFHMGGSLANETRGPFRVCIDDVRLEDPDFIRPARNKAAPPAPVLTNQVGYFPGLVKLATVRTGGNAPQPWRLVDGAGREVKSGQTQVAGTDALAGDTVQIADFSPVAQQGRGFAIVVGSGRSHPFDISPAIYHKLKYDALTFYYHNRSGIEIVMPYAGGPQWTRPAGHLSDRSVPCAFGSGCSYRLDVSGGWYDAGDHGKYVVNGGISVWTLLNLYERTKYLGTSLADFGDRRMNIPEQGNGVPDLLDEVRWEMEFLLKMQVPDGDRAGMVHHKIHDKEWTALGLAPHEDPMPRFLYPPSTAATLNLAAVAAQAARIWQSIDPAFSARCLAAAERAWQAAQSHPAVFAPPGGVGGGPYEDIKVDDEFYWAAAELYITSKKPEYKQFLVSSPYYLKLAPRLPSTKEGGDVASPMTWQETAALGTISLAVVPNGLGDNEIATARKAVTKAADAYVQILQKRGYRVPIDYGKANQAPWGSNSFLLNNLVVLALAHDFNGGQRYLNAAVAGMDYILGRNPMDQCYVTGYGARPLLNPHHRFWSHQSNEKFPSAPPGVVSGGPNSGLEDPYVKAAALAGCAPEKCFADNIESWATNEITINWNAPFAWVLAYLDEQGSSPPKGKRAAATASPTTGEAASAPKAEPTPKADATTKTKTKRAAKAKARHKKSGTTATN